jgi:hypothetical protein
MTTVIPDLHISQTPGARVEKLGEAAWHLEIPARGKGGYCLAQLDDHGSHRRAHFPWKAPLKFSLQARVSAQGIPGTWGFGLWNDPFSMSMGLGGMAQRMPALPNAAWFFHASPQNYLSFRDDLPAQGFLAATFKSKNLSSLWLALASPALALTLIPGAAQLVRRLLRRVIQQDAAQIHTDVTAWHTYSLEWETGQVGFYLDGVDVLQTDIVPAGPLSLVIWVDNQYAALPPRGRLRFGTLPSSEPAWLEIREFSMQGKA